MRVVFFCFYKYNCRDIFALPKGKYFLFLNVACCLCKKLRKVQIFLASPMKSLVRAYVCVLVYSNEKLSPAYFLVTRKSFTVFHWFCLLHFFLSFCSCITYLVIRAHFCHKMKVDDLQSNISQLIAADTAKYLAKFHGSELTEKLRVTKLNSRISFPKVCRPYPSQNILVASMFHFTFSVLPVSESTFNWSSV